MSVLDVSTGAGYIAKIEYQSFVDGEGVRCSVYVSGCPFQCQGCYNKAAQHFRYGEAMTHTVMEEVLDACAPEYIAGLSILEANLLQFESCCATCSSFSCTIRS